MSSWGVPSVSDSVTPPLLKNPGDAPGADRDPLRHNLSQ